LKTFDADVVRKWGDLICEQGRRMEMLGVPYFAVEEDVEHREYREKILAFLEDLVLGES
jgi:hypothetical protein